MARYRWGFETEVGGVPTFEECFPLVEDGTSLDYSQQTNEIFYRAKLNGSITFRFSDFDYILQAGYNATHIIVLQHYVEADEDWREVWRGKFVLTDCTIDYETHTIDVSPETEDRYTKVLENLEKEYNLVKLKAKMNPVNILIRPCLQIYKYGSMKIANFIGGNSWDSGCDAPTSVDDLTDTFKFEELRDCIWFTGVVKSGVNAGKNVVYYGRFLFLGSDMVVPMDGRIYNSDGTYIEEEAAYNCLIHHDNGHKWLFSIQQDGTADLAMACFYDDRSGSDNNESYTEGDIFEDTYLCWDRVFGRTICNTTADDVTIGGSTYTLYAISANDMAGINLNYNKVMQKAFASIEPSIDTATDPTTWPQDTFGRYFVKPTNTATIHYWAASPETWMSVGYWWYADAREAEVEEKLTATRKINDCYDYRSVILKLLNKAGLTPNYIISYCLGGTNDYVGTRTDLRITARSNVISSYYDTPAQNAPISLSKILTMLKIVYQCYWYIDGNGNFHIEHISYFDNGYSTTEDEPELLVDLEAELHTRTLNNKVYGQNQVKFDKSDMPEQYEFGWADSVTRPFVGYPINCLDAYVQKGNISEQKSADFDSDVDYVLSSPNDVNKDGFFLFALPAEGADYSDTLKTEKVTITDEAGETYDVTIQNADAAFVKIHETWWRWHLPCENVNINNEDSVALSTGSYKAQSVEFADTASGDILANVDDCVKLIRTQQGNGHIKTISINLNSYATKADLLFNFIGRWYYLRGTALGASITIYVNNEAIELDVSNNSWKHKYQEPITALDFSGTDVVSVNFADCDNLNGLTSCDNMFKNCAELLAVDFANKTFGAVTSASNMFKGCSQLSTLLCPPTESWKADLDFSDCPDLTLESLNDLINDFLYVYDSGTHTITPNATMWNALEGAVQDDIIARATAKGWTIATPARYVLSGTSAGSAVYGTINGNAVEIEVVGGTFTYNYNTPITSFSFASDTNLQTIDFSLSDGLAGVTSMAASFSGCTSLVSVDFTDCDLSNLANAASTFSGCTALTTITADSGVWQPDLDLSDSAMAYSDMLSTIGILYTYNSGTHTITFNSTTWDALSVAQQQTIFDAAQLKYWTTNAVAIVYYIRGKSTAASETFAIQFIQNGSLTPDASETITCAVDGNGDFEYQYLGKKIYSLYRFAYTKNTISALDFSAADDFSQLVNAEDAFYGCIGMTSVAFGTQTFSALTNAYRMFYDCYKLPSIDLQNAIFPNLLNANSMFLISGSYFNSALTTAIDLRNATFANVTSCEQMFWQQKKLTTLNLSAATFANTTNVYGMFRRLQTATSLNLPSATFASATNLRWMFYECSALQSVNLGAATFASATNATAMFQNDTNLSTITWSPNLNFSNLQTIGTAGADEGMFEQCGLTSLDFTGQTFANVTIATGAFYLPKATFIKMPDATFERLTNAQVMFIGASSNNPLTELDLSSATFASCTNSKRLFDRLHNLTTLKLSQNSTALAVSTLPTDGPIDLQWSPLSYQSMLNAANWVRDFTGYSAHTMTFRAASWNALSSAEQSTIDGILSGKNWTRAIA